MQMPFEEFQQMYRFDALLEADKERSQPHHPEDMPIMYVLSSSLHLCSLCPLLLFRFVNIVD